MIAIGILVFLSVLLQLAGLCVQVAVVGLLLQGKNRKDGKGDLWTD